MGASLYLYKVLPDVDYKGFYLDFYKPAGMFTVEDMIKLDKYEQSIGAPDPVQNRKQYFEWFDEQEKHAWSDGKKHTLLDISYYTSLFGKYRGWNRILKRLDKFQLKYFDNFSYTKKYLACEEICCAKGWFLKHRFFKKDITCSICTTKEQMQHFFKQYIRYTSRDKRGPEIAKRFLEAWEDGMIFLCIW